MAKQLSDSDVPRIADMSKTAGWRTEHLPRDYDTYVYVSPAGLRYVKAEDDEPATLIREYPDLPPTRLVDLEHSRAMDRVADRLTELETGETIIQTRKTKNRKIRQARVKRHKPTES